jgi:arylsulfatase A-like enzyme
VLYDAKVREVDEHFAQIFRVLEGLDVLKDSVVIITSDHGDEFGEHGGLSHDGKMYQELVLVPLLVYDGERRNTLCDVPVSGIDIPPTVISLFSLEPVKGFKGQSIVPPPRRSERGCFGEAIEKTGPKIKEADREIYYYLDENLKTIYHVAPDEWEMYDLKADPRELHGIVISAQILVGIMHVQEMPVWPKSRTGKRR